MLVFPMFECRFATPLHQTKTQTKTKDVLQCFWSQRKFQPELAAGAFVMLATDSSPQGGADWQLTLAEVFLHRIAYRLVVGVVLAVYGARGSTLFIIRARGFGFKLGTGNDRG